MDGYKDQDARLNGMDRIVTDLYGTTRLRFDAIDRRCVSVGNRRISVCRE